MNYDDASSSQIAAGSAPDARPDIDALNAGDLGPAAGNVISGTGTITGAAGADSVSDGAGRIVALRGSSGTDSSDADGSLHVRGRYGELTVDTDGDYSYTRSSQTPNGVTDVFTYTLADNAGDKDQATLTIDIRKELEEISADAQQLVPGPDGVVVLPAGVQLSDIRVIGSNLVIILPDGSQMVIPNGAVFVPQLVIGDVEVPPTNLAALLIDAEPRPASGTPQSSGGNFGVEVGPLDPGVPLGDLIPPTELTYTPPEFRDAGQEIDEEPEISIQPDGQPASVAAVDSVEEAGLPTRNGGEPAGSDESADGNGADNDVPSETTTGTIIVDVGDGPSVVTITGANGVPQVVTVGLVVQGEFGTLTITGQVGDNFTYSYTLTDNTSGNDTHDDFSVSVEDSDGDVATATLRIDIVDDVPTAVNDTDSIAAGEFGPATGNVITDAHAGDAGDSDDGADTVGADDAELTAVTGAGETTVNEGGDFVVEGEFGVLTIDSEGNYSYVRNEGTPGGVEDVFTYTLTDGDGDTDTATLTIDIGDLDVTVGENPLVRTDDDAVPGAEGNPGGPEDDVDAQNLSGTLSGSGGDGGLTFDLLTTGAPEGFSYVNGPNGSVLVQQVQNGSAVTVLTITVDASTGDYTVTQNAPILHDSLDGEEGDDTENNVEFTINYTVTDLDGDSDSGTLTINVDDDTPVVIQEAQSTGTVDEDGVPGGIAGGTGDVPGEDTVATGDVSALFAPGADQPLTFNLLTDTSGLEALTSNGVALTYEVDGDTLTASAGENTVFTFTLNADGTWTFTLLDQLDHAEGGDENDLTIDLSSLVQATDVDGDSVSAGPRSVLITVDDDTPAPSGGTVSRTVDEDGVPGGIAGGPADVAGQSTVATGSLTTLFNSGADAPLSFTLAADTSGLPALTSNGVAVTYEVDGDTLTASAGGNDVFTLVVNEDGSFTFTLLDQLDHPTQDGTANDNTENNLLIDFSSIIEATDADGDTVGAGEGAFVINVDDDTPTASGEQVTGTVDEDGVPGGIAGGTGDVPGTSTLATGSVTTLFNSGADAPLSFTLATETSGLPALTSNGVAVTYEVNGDTLTASAGGTDVFTFTLNADGTWEFELLDQLDHPTLDGEAGDDTENDLTIDLSSIIEATDADGDTVTANVDGLVITVDDDTPGQNGTVTTVFVDEDNLPEGNAGGPGDGPGGSAGPIAVGIASLFASGADQPLTVSLSTDTSGLPALTSGGVAVTYELDGNTLTASAGGSDVFTIVLNPDTGVATFTLLGQLDHPSQDGTVNDNTENNLVLDFSSLFVGTDADGDSITLDAGSYVVNVDDDTPEASEAQVTGTVDEDGVLEGADDNGEGDGIAGGTDDVAGEDTVATGSVATLFSPGADQPLTYNLLTDTSGLPALTSGGTALVYSVVGDTLTATAGPGGETVFTFTLEADGDWTFTLVDQIDHAEGDDENDLEIELGSIIQATDADGDSVTAAADGLVITVDDDTPIATGAQVTGTVDEDGVVESGTDEGDGIAGGPEDVAGQATVASGSVSTMFQSGADAPLSYGFTANAIATLQALALTSNGLALEYEVDGDTITASTAAGDVFTFQLTEDGDWTFTLIDQLDHPTLDGEEGDDTENDLEIALGSIVQATDADGDSVAGNADGLVITVDDDTPVARNDEDTIVSGGDTATGNVITGAGTDTGASGSDDTGADAPAVITGLVGAESSDDDPSGGGFVAEGEFGVLTMQEDGSYSYDRNDDAPGDVEDIFTYSYTDADGDTVTATLTINIQDDAPVLTTPDAILLDDDDVSGADGNPGGPEDDDPTIASGTLSATGGDIDNDFFFSASQPALPTGFSFNQVDDGTMQILQGATVVLTITLDNETGDYSVVQNNPIDHESLDGETGDDTENNAGPFNVSFFAEDVDGDESDPVNLVITVDDDTPVLENVTAGGGVDVDETDAGSPDGFPISDTSADPVIDADMLFGADGPAAANSIVYGLAIVGGDGTDSGLMTAQGDHPITLEQIDSNTIEGHYDGSNVAFVIEINADGTVTLTQNVPLEHLDDGGPAPTDHNDTLDLTGLINATVTITDADGDSTSDSAPIGDNLVFFDDGPDAQVDTGATLDQLVLDETRPIGEETDGDSDPAGLMTTTANFANNFEGPADFGGDGAGTVTYSLFLSAASVGSGLYALEQADTTAGDSDGIGQGAEIMLSLSLDGLTITGSAGGTDYFTIEIDPDTGIVTFTQLNNIWHGSTASDDDTSTLTTSSAANVQVVQTVTDSDGDFDTAAVNVGQGVFHIEDDGPEFTALPEAAVVENGDTTLQDNLDLNLEIGTDGFGLLFFDDAIDGDPAMDNEGNPLSFNGEPLFYQVNGNVLTLETTGNGDDVAATITLNTDGTYDFQLHGTISNGTETSFTNLTSTAAGNTDFRLLGQDTAVNNAENIDIIFSGRSSDGTQGTINTNADAVGVDNQSTNSGEFVRIDFVENLETVVGPGDPANGPQGFHHSGHVETTHFEQLIHQTSSNADTNVDIRVFAMTADEDHVYDNNPLDGVEAGESIEEITSVTITFAQGQVHTFDPTVPSSLSFLHTNADGTGTTTTTVVFNVDGSVTIQNLQEGDVYEIDSVDTFNAVIVTNVEAPEPAGDSLDLGIFSIGTASTGDPIVQDFDIVAQDRDGDQETSTITTTINPPADTLAATSFAAQEEQLQKTAANTNTLTMAAAVAAAGVASMPAAAHDVAARGGQGVELEAASLGNQHVARGIDAADPGQSALLGEAQASASVSAQASSSASAAGEEHGPSDANALTGAADDSGPAVSQLSEGTDAPAQADPAPAAAAQTVAMPSAEMLEAAADSAVDPAAASDAQAAEVARVLAEALHGGGQDGADIDTLLASLPGNGEGALAAIQSLASHAHAGVPGWDMAALGTMHNQPIFSMDMVAMHQDAGVQQA